MSDTEVAVDHSGHPRIHADGEMARLISEKDWSATPLGPIDSWSPTLIAVVNNMLNYPFSFALYWGPDRTMLYNDTYCTFLYDKHPWALGSPAEQVWGEAWEQVGPEIDGAYQGRKTLHNEALIQIFENGRLEDHWFTYGLYPSTKETGSSA